MAGQIHDARTRAPISGAQVCVVLASTNGLADSDLWRDQDWSAIRNGIHQLLSQEDGTFECRVPNRTDQAIVTVRALGYQTKTVRTDGGELRLGLQPAAPIKVLVQSATSEPIAQAVVTQSPLAWDLLLPSRNTPTPRPEWFSGTTATTDATGVASFSPLESSSTFFAQLGSQKSNIAKAGPDGELVVLTLRPTIKAYGRIHSPPGTTNTPKASVVIFAANAPAADEKLILSSREDGTWGPVEVPIPETGALRFKATATGAAPSYQVADCPDPGGELQVDFFLESGHPLFMLVVDEDANPIPGARAYTSWGSTEGWMYAGALTNKSGHAEILCPSRTLVSMGAAADDYFTAEITSVNPAKTQGDPRILTLLQAGGLTGNCEFHGPLPSQFKITYWNPSRGLYREKTFSTDPDGGAFAIKSVPVGTLHVLATHDDGQTPSQTLEIRAGEGQHAELTFGPPIDISGNVIDGATGAPVSASIRLHAMSGNQPLFQYGPTHHTDAAGAFSFSGLSLGENYLELNSEGYAPLTRNLSAATNKNLKMGELRMLPLVTLTVQVFGHEVLGECWLSIERGKQQLVPIDGLVTFKDVAPDYYLLRMTEKGGYGSTTEIFVPAHRQVYIEYDAPDTVELEIKATPHEGSDLPVGCAAEVLQHDPLGRALERHKELSINGTATIVGIHPGPAIVRIFDAANQTLAIAPIDLEPHPENSIEIRLEGSAGEILVLDESGIPLPNALVTFSLPDGATGWYGNYETDASGHVSIRGQDFPKLVAAVRHSTRYDFHNELDLNRDAPTTITLDAHSNATATVADNGFPISGLDIYCKAARTEFYLPTIATDATGTLTWSNISAGPYVLEIEDSALWPLTREIEVSGDETHVDVDVRRKGNLLLTVRNELGTPVSDAVVSLTSNEFSTSVSTWLASDLVLTSTGTMRTDESGKLRVSGVPNGEYTLDVNGSAANVTIPAWSTLEHEVALEPVH